jgi:hypothetical protein
LQVRPIGDGRPLSFFLARRPVHGADRAPPTLDQGSLDRSERWAGGLGTCHPSQRFSFEQLLRNS